MYGFLLTFPIQLNPMESIRIQPRNLGNGDTILAMSQPVRIEMITIHQGEFLLHFTWEGKAMTMRVRPDDTVERIGAKQWKQVPGDGRFLN